MSCPETQQRYISGYGKVLSRTWNGSEGFLCLGRGDILLIHPYMLFLFTVPNLSSTLAQQSLFALSRPVHSASGQLGNLAAQRLLLVTEVHLVLATAVTVARAGCQRQGELNGTSASSLLSLVSFKYKTRTGTGIGPIPVPEHVPLDKK